MPQLQRRAGFAVWFTGLPSSGKTTLASLLGTWLPTAGQAAEVLDGDVVREILSKGLGYSREDRDLNIKRIGFLCRILSRNGVAAIAAVVSPYRAARDTVRDAIRSEIGDRFIEVHTDCPVEVCIQRDVKGLYKKALAGEIKGFTGVDDPYEPPQQPELVLKTHLETPQESLARVTRLLQERRLIPAGD